MAALKKETEDSGSTSDDDDDSIGKVGQVNAKSGNSPATITVEDEVFDIAFHPNKNIIGTAEISGKISIFSYSLEDNMKLCDFSFHKKACRCLTFSFEGNKLYSCSKDKSIKVIDMNTGSVVHSISKAHGKAVNKIKLVSEYYVASGSDDGSVKVWDTRTYSSICEFTDRQDYISDMTCDKDKRLLLCTSGDGVLSVYNMRQKKLEKASDQLDEELLSLAIIKNSQKVVCGSGDGTLNIYSWGQWGDVSDRIPTKNNSIDAICAVTDDVLCTGGDDGYIRSWYIMPHRALGVIGNHGTLGIENLRLSSDKKLLGSCCSENTVKFWDVSELHEHASVVEKQKKKNRKRKMDENCAAAENFFGDL